MHSPQEYRQLKTNSVYPPQNPGCSLPLEGSDRLARGLSLGVTAARDGRRDGVWQGFLPGTAICPAKRANTAYAALCPPCKQGYPMLAALAAAQKRQPFPVAWAPE